MESPLRAESEDPQLRLIETALWDGAGCPRLAGHLARLSRGAQALGWPCDIAAARAALTGPLGEPARLRLTLDRDGRIAVTQAALPPSPPLWHLALAGDRLDAGDPWLRLKTTRRAQYDAARAALPPGIHEAIFLNQRGEVCDGSITTLFFDRGQGLRTPPLDSGLLDGVLRAELLAQGVCHQEVLAAHDLPHVRLWVGNALRGLMPALWVG